MVARWGGEEFAVGMFGMAQQDAVQRMTGLLEAFRQEPFTYSRGSGVSCDLQCRSRSVP